MAKKIEVNCPNCGASLEIPPDFDRAFCSHCGGEFIITDDDNQTQESNSNDLCPTCKGRGTIRCAGSETITVAGRFGTYELYAESCSGLGKCIVYCYPEKDEFISNYCRDGKCAFCKGTGRSFFRKCPFCEGTGDCRFCMGSGKCKFCNGRGKIRCRVCDGRGVIR